MAADLLLKTSQLKALNAPSKRNYKGVLHFMENDGGQLFEQESEFIYHRQDLVTLRPDRDYAWLDGKIERALQILRCQVVQVQDWFCFLLISLCVFCNYEKGC